jgi:hypothetical protein
MSQNTIQHYISLHRYDEAIKSLYGRLPFICLLQLNPFEISDLSCHKRSCGECFSKLYNVRKKAQLSKIYLAPPLRKILLQLLYICLIYGTLKNGICNFHLGQICKHKHCSRALNWLHKFRNTTSGILLEMGRLIRLTIE